MADKSYTLKDFLKLLSNRADGVSEDGKIVTKKNPAMRNFLDTHSIERTERGVPVWRRLPVYYSRGRINWDAAPNRRGQVPGGARRRIAKGLPA